MNIGTMVVLIVLVAVIAIIIYRMVNANKKYEHSDCLCDCSKCEKCNLPHTNRYTVSEADETGTKLSD